MNRKRDMKRKSLLIIGALLSPPLLIALISSIILAWADNNGEALKMIGLVLIVSSCLIFGVLTPLWMWFKSKINAAMLRDYGEESCFFVQRERQRRQMSVTLQSHGKEVFFRSQQKQQNRRMTTVRAILIKIRGSKLKNGKRG